MKKLLASLSVFAFAFAIGLLYQSHQLAVSAKEDSDEWQSGPCIQVECGKPEGKKQQYRTVTECSYSCPTVHFEYKEYKDCPSGYKPKGDDKCEKEHNPNKGNIIDREYTVISYDVTYDKSADPNKCHRPSDDTLRDDYKMNRDARDAFKRANGEWKDSEKKCESHQETRVVSCQIPPQHVVPCDPTITPSPTPTESEERPTPTPTQGEVDLTATPTITLTPGLGKVAALEYQVSCDKDEVKAEMRFTNDGKPMENVTAEFDYNGNKKTATSNSDGWAIVIYPRDGENKLTGYADGFYKIEKTVEFPDCPATGGAVLGTSTTSRGQVLGATSYAKTGIVADTLMQLTGVLGTLMVSAGALMHAKQK